jgi:hypothetical protein
MAADASSHAKDLRSVIVRTCAMLDCDRKEVAHNFLASIALPLSFHRMQLLVRFSALA